MSTAIVAPCSALTDAVVGDCDGLTPPSSRYNVVSLATVSVAAGASRPDFT